MASTSATELAHALLDGCLREHSADEEVSRRLIELAAVDPEASRAFFGIVIERLGDLFEPALCDVYADLFSRAVEHVEPELRAGDLAARYRRVRTPRRVTQDPFNVFVLSRVTLGADVVVTSTILDAVLQRFPHANIWFVGPRKNHALFAGHPRVDRLAFDYPRGGTLTDRVSVWRNLQRFFTSAGGIVVDTDSRLTQLGLLPVCPEEDYFFFESRGYGGSGEETLGALTRRWAIEVFGVEDARPFLVPAVASTQRFDITVSFGVGENVEKRVPGPFERDLIRSLAPRRVTLDRGAGGEEAERAEATVAGLDHAKSWRGEYAHFAGMVAKSRLYVGYDSAGQHVAAAAGVPLVSVFAGYASERMYQRWRPSGLGRIEVVKVAPGEPADSVLERTLAAVRLIG